MTLAWARAQALLVVFPQENSNALEVASEAQDVRLRWDGHQVFMDRRLDLKCTRAGFSPEVRFFVKSVEQPYLRVNIGQRIGTWQTAVVQ